MALRREGKSVIYITHRLAEVFRICDRVSVLRNGELVATRDVSALDRKSLIELMLGRPFAEMYPEPRAPRRWRWSISDILSTVGVTEKESRSWAVDTCVGSV